MPRSSLPLDGAPHATPPWIKQWLAAPDALARAEVVELRLGLLGRCPRGHVVRRTLRGTLVAHDIEGLEPIGTGYWSGRNAEGIGHLQCTEEYRHGQ